jgi:hypothetical protein
MLRFLLSTAAWFRFDHASRKDRFVQPFSHEFIVDTKTHRLIEELQWQYSLRSNLLLFGCLLAAYLIWIQELAFLLAYFGAISLVNVVTDRLYNYEVELVPKAKKGHRIAAVVIWLATVLYLSL